MSERSRDIASKEFTDITVDWGPVDHVLVPYDRVDTLHKASKTGPDHVQARARIPSYAIILERVLRQLDEYLHVTFKVPVEGNDTKHKPDEREGTVHLIRRGIHYSSRMCN